MTGESYMIYFELFFHLVFYTFLEYFILNKHILYLIILFKYLILGYLKSKIKSAVRLIENEEKK